MKRLWRSRRHLAVAVTALTVVIWGFPIPPSHPISARAQTNSVSETPVIAEPIPDEAREPADVALPVPGVVDPDDVVPDAGNGTTAASILGDEVPVPEEGGPDFDAYAPAPDVGSHFLFVQPEVVNEQASDGSWVNLPTKINPFSGGWVIEGETFSVVFPSVLSANAPVTHNTETGSISQVPVGAVDSTGALQSDGTLIYRDVLPDTDLVYGVAPGGFKETVILRSSTAPSTLAWSLVVEGYGVIAEDDGSIQLTGQTEPFSRCSRQPSTTRPANQRRRRAPSCWRTMATGR
jgi:hypothetical protein